MSESQVITITTEDVGKADERPRRKRKPPSEWKKTARLSAIKDKEPDFIGKFELAKHLCCHIQTINEWIYDGTLPPPHSWPGVKHPVWLRRHYNHYLKAGKWPAEAWRSRKPGEE